MAKISRNQPCPCGSGKKYKKCCLSKDNSPPSASPPQRDDVHRAADTDGPSSPSVEMLDEWMQDGYHWMLEGDSARACDSWSTVWDVIRSRLSSTMRTCDHASSVFDGTQCLFNWLQDYCLELTNAAVAAPRYASDGIGLCEHVLGQFVDESPLFLRNFRTDLGQFHFLAGSPEEGERVLLEVIRDHPDTAVGYVRLAELLAYGARQRDAPIAPERAQRLLEEALARPVKDAAKYDLEGRLEDLHNEVATALIDKPRQGSD